MINNKRIIVVLPAYNAGKTLLNTYNEIPFDIVDDVILVDDNSTDNTVEVANQLGISHDTVKLHVRHILSKLKLRSRVEAAVFAIEHKLEPPEAAQA